MKKLILLLSFLIVPLTASAQPHEALLTPDGTLYTLDTVLTRDHADVDTDSDMYLLLTRREGADTWQEIVPATRGRGSHSHPAMAFDAESGMLFVFWVRQSGLLYSELVFASRDLEGNWSGVTAFGDQFDYRDNLRIAVTRRVVDDQGALAPTPAVSVHAAWWEFDSLTGTESAQYAMLSIENGRVAEINRLDLSDFVEPSSADADDERANLLKQPMLFASPKQDSVVIVFGDHASGRIHQVRVRPTLPPLADGRLRVPIGRREGNAPAPRTNVASNSRIDGIYGDTDKMAIYSRSGEKLHYIILKDGEWSGVRTIALDERVTSGAAVDALRRLVHEN